MSHMESKANEKQNLDEFGALYKLHDYFPVKRHPWVNMEKSERNIQSHFQYQFISIAIIELKVKKYYLVNIM